MQILSAPRLQLPVGSLPIPELLHLQLLQDLVDKELFNNLVTLQSEFLGSSYKKNRRNFDFLTTSSW